MKRFGLGLTLMGAGVSLCIAVQPPELPGGSEAEPVVGTLLGRNSEAMDWQAVAPGQVSQASWLETAANGEAVVAFRNSSHLRMAPNTTVHVTSSSTSNLKLEVLRGRILVDVPEDGRSQVSVDTPKGGMSSSGGVTVVEASDESSTVNALTGMPLVTAERLSVPNVGVLTGRKSATVMPGVTVALEGPDVRRRNKKRGNFVQGEESGPKRLGEDEVPSPSPSPAATPPPVIQQPPPRVVAPPPDTTPVVTEGGGGGEIWPYFLGLGAIGTGAYFLLRDDTDNNSGGLFGNGFVPASP